MEEARFQHIVAMASIAHAKPWINELVEYTQELRKHVSFLEKQRACLICDMAEARLEIGRLSVLVPHDERSKT